MSTQALRAALRKRCPAPGWALLEEVRESVGHGSKRSADAIAMTTWESRGLELHGFELKASRADWLRELASPEKCEPITRFCDRWWIVASDASIVLDGELPPAWGLLVLRGKVLQTVTEAPKREAVPAPDRGFLAALLRRATEQFATMVPQDEVSELVRAKVEATIIQRSYEPDVAALRSRAELLDLFEAKLGVKIWGVHQVEQLAHAYALIQAVDGLRWKMSQLEQAASTAGEISRELRAAVKKIREVEAEPIKGTGT